MLASVIAPAYNHENYIVSFLESVADQTYDDIEIVLIDDCSSDRTFEIAADFLHSPKCQGVFSNVICLKNKRNLGAANTINLAISLSKGDCIFVANTDDIYDRRRVEHLVRIIDSGHRLAFSGVGFIDAAGDVALSNDALEFKKAVSEICRYPTVSLSLISKNRALSTGNFCFTRDLWDEVGTFASLRYCHDWDFILRAILIEEPAFDPERLYLYRLHESNSFRSLSAVAQTETEICLEKFFCSAMMGSVRNKALRPFLFAGEFWDRFIASIGGVHSDVWARFNSVDGMKRQKRSSNSSDLDIELPTAEFEQYERGDYLRETPVGKPVQFIVLGGDYYDDKWIGDGVLLKYTGVPCNCRLICTLFLPAGMSSRFASATVKRNNVDIGVFYAKLEAGKFVNILNDLCLPGEGDVTIAINIIGVVRSAGSDIRRLGALLSELTYLVGLE